MLFDFQTFFSKHIFWQYLEQIGLGKSRVIPSLINRPLLWSPPSPNCHQPLSCQPSGLVWHRSKITFIKHFQCDVPMSRARKESDHTKCSACLNSENIIGDSVSNDFTFCTKCERGECILEHILPFKCSSYHSRSKHLKLPGDVSQSPPIVAEAVSLVRCRAGRNAQGGGLGLTASQGSSAMLCLFFHQAIDLSWGKRRWPI